MNRRVCYIHIGVVILFTAITFLMTYPTLFNLTHSIIGDYGDSLLNTWILAWDVHKITSGELWSIFNANIFYPSTNTLAYSEHLLGEALWALPVLVVSKNPVMTYNLLFLFALILSAFGMYLLVFDLTTNRYAAFISGVIFGFFPWRFAHLAHLQLQMSQWIPFTFFYLHRFIKDGSYKNAFLLTIFFDLQFLSCGYYGIYLTFFIFLLVTAILLSRNNSHQNLVKPLGLFVGISAIIIFPIYYHYVKAKQEMGFTRPLSEAIFFSPDLLSYLSATVNNRLWGKLTPIYWKAEGELFLGLTAIFLGFIGIFSVIQRKNRPAKRDYRIIKSDRVLKTLKAVIDLLIIFDFLVALIVFFTGGISSKVFGFTVSATSLDRPLGIILFLVGIRLLVERLTQGRFWPLKSSFISPVTQFYFWMLLLSFLFSLGPIIHFQGKPILKWGPYIFLYYVFPGFNGLRVPSRFIIMVAFSLSVLSGFGLANLLTHIKRISGKAVITVWIAVLLLVEYASFPIAMASIPTGEKVPLVYQWLSKQKGDFPVLELPLPRDPSELWIEAPRVYYSTYHWKRLVNGYSGYFPHDYYYLFQKGMKGFPSEDSLETLKKLGIKYLIIHYDEYGELGRESLRPKVDNDEGFIRPVIRFENDAVYEVTVSK